MHLFLSSDAPFDIENVAILMIFPYFLESHVSESFPSLKMMDYKVRLCVLRYYLSRSDYSERS